jgi:hypothetical protein
MEKGGFHSEPVKATNADRPRNEAVGVLYDTRVDPCGSLQVLRIL